MKPILPCGSLMLVILKEVHAYHNLYYSHDRKFISAQQTLRGLDTIHRFSAILYKGDNLCDFLFAFLHTKSLLKRGLV